MPAFCCKLFGQSRKEILEDSPFLEDGDFLKNKRLGLYKRIRAFGRRWRLFVECYGRLATMPDAASYGTLAPHDENKQPLGAFLLRIPMLC